MRRRRVLRRRGGARIPALRPGFALIAALWLTVAISAVALEFTLWARTRRLAAANLVEAAAARAAARAGLQHLESRLAARLVGYEPGAAPLGELVDPWWGVDSLLVATQALGTARYRVDARDAASMLNLNVAPEAELTRFFAALGAPESEADRVAEAILDWRDADDEPRAAGAERDAYLAHGRRVLPRNAPMEDVSELRDVLGVTDELYARALPHVTVQGGGAVNLNSAGAPVLLSLPGMTEAAVEAALRRRLEGRPLVSILDLAYELPPDARYALEAEAPDLAARTVLEVQQVELRSTGWTPGSPVRATVHALVSRNGKGMHLDWLRLE